MVDFEFFYIFLFRNKIVFRAWFGLFLRVVLFIDGEGFRGFLFRYRVIGVFC